MLFLPLSICFIGILSITKKKILFPQTFSEKRRRKQCAHSASLTVKFHTNTHQYNVEFNFKIKRNSVFLSSVNYNIAEKTLLLFCSLS